jgi:hypothetical protein
VHHSSIWNPLHGKKFPEEESVQMQIKDRVLRKKCHDLPSAVKAVALLGFKEKVLPCRISIPFASWCPALRLIRLACEFLPKNEEQQIGDNALPLLGAEAKAHPG